MAGLYFEEFSVGQLFRHEIRKTVTEADNVLFCALTYNPAAIHIDYDHCEIESPYGKPLVNSVYTLGLMVGVSVQDTTLGTTIANLGWDAVTFPKPVFIGDTLRTETTVIDLRASKSRPDCGVVTFEHRSFNQSDDIVASCKRTALMKRRPER
jgi:acyl dehydratase